MIGDATLILSTKFEHMKKLHHMLSTERLPTYFEEDNQYPVINIFDMMSLKTWITLRKVFMHYKEQRLASLTLAVAILMGIQIFILSTIALFHFQILHSESLNLSKYLTFFAIDTTLFLITISILIYYCVRVNNEYQIHRNLVRINKGIAINMFRFYP
ncbi:MAG: hypothetical protein EOP45_22050, partial [Sphingobacteriaceae bacterium]